MMRLALVALLATQLGAAPLGQPQAPGPAQNIGTDAGSGGPLLFSPGACLRVSDTGAWGFNVVGWADGGSLDGGASGYPQLVDGGPAINWATCQFLLLADAGPMAQVDGGPFSWPAWNYLSNDKDGFCLNGSQNTIYACSIDGGVFNAAARFTP